MKHVDLIADGSCLSNHGPGGWACILQYKTAERVLTGGSPVATNNQMELRAVTMGLRALREPCAVSVFTDSTYVQDGMSRLISLWKENSGETVAKQSRTTASKSALVAGTPHGSTGHPISWHSVKGHSSDRDHNRCDSLARQAARSMLKAAA